MFAYCGNNPVCCKDVSGTRHCAATTVSEESRYDRKLAYQHQNKIAKENAFRKEYAEELAVIEGKTDKYKVVKVWRLDTGGGSFSFGTIFLDSNIEPNIEGVLLLRHEYGYIRQLEEYGIFVYTTFVAIPSVTGFWRYKKGKLTMPYYSQPWEFDADLRGNVGIRKGNDMYLEVYSLYYIVIECLTSSWCVF